jgi:hypothetical protein
LAIGGSPKRVKADPQLQIELEVCHDYKIPHSEFLSWSQDDRDKAIWMHVRNKQTCGRCGTRAEEWDPEQGGHRHAYLAQADVCRGCQALEARENAMTDEQRGAGVHIVLRRNTGG